MRATLANRDHRALDECPNPLDDIPVGHRDSYDWNTPPGGWRGEERALAFEDPDQPEEVLIVDRVASTPMREAVSMGQCVDAICGAAKQFRTATGWSTTISAAITP
jgi:hypothetical protein